MTLNWHFFTASGVAAEPIDFNRDIRPILNQNCIACHGGVKQQGGVSFVYREEALSKGKSGRPTVVPGKPYASELIARVTSTDLEARMPYHAPPLPPEQIALLRQWIKEGAQWQEHWAFVAPKPQALPEVKEKAWIKQPLDQFVLARLEKEGLHPSAEADKAALLRRVSFDITGLPPTAQELAAFLTDTSPEAYEKQVDRLLASPHYGERWAAMWLELARYADSKGYERDFNRITWIYRDWVIDAFNQNLAYDRFVITQLAGDLLPDSTLEDQIATSFQRQTPANDEGGSDDEEFRLAAVMDRVATTWSVLNGVTINCVQCHSHPYDPIRHEEYYKFLAFYNTSRDADRLDDAPILFIPNDASLRTEVARVEQRRGQLLTEIVHLGRSLSEQTSWTKLPIKAGVVNESLVLQAFSAKLKQAKRSKTLEKSPFAKISNQGIEDTNSHPRAVTATTALPSLKIEDGEARAVGTIPASSVYELTTDSAPSTVTALRIEVPPLNPGKARHTPEDGFIVSRIDVWTVSPQGEERKIAFRYFAPDSEEILAADVRQKRKSIGQKASLLDPFEAPSSRHDQSVGAFAANPKLFKTRWIVAVPKQPLSIEAGSHLKVRLWHSERITERPAYLRRVRFDTSRDERWTRLANDQMLAVKLAELAQLENRLTSIPSTPVPVMAEQTRAERRQTLVFERGNFLTKIGSPLAADVPALFPKLPAHAPRDRLTMAKWFFAPGQPLTARMAVNRYWEQLFGTGIVETLEDFGSAGEPPSHPELLDWLALHFKNDLRWDMKALLRELVTSATYRQDAKITPALAEKDPHNRLLARGPQQRLTAEMVRDQALLASGLLTPTMGGPPVMPPQPEGLWMIPNGPGDDKWIDATGPDRYRRAVYTYLKRSVIYPSFTTFDASNHDVSLPRRIVTNTPLQALVTLNDPVYQEAAEALARRMMAIEPEVLSPPNATARLTGTALLEARLNYGARRVLSRDLSPKERSGFVALYEDMRRMSAANKELAAFTTVASVLFNLDAALTR